MDVSILICSNDHLLQIDVTETDGSGDWTVYDHYFFGDREEPARLSPMINVLSGDGRFADIFEWEDRDDRNEREGT